MSERKRIYYTYKSLEAWKKYEEGISKIIKDDSKQENWICTTGVPPTCYSPPLREDAIEKIKKLSDDIVVGEIKDDD